MSRSNPTPYSAPPPRARKPREPSSLPSFSPKVHEGWGLGKWAEGIPLENLRRWADMRCQCAVCSGLRHGTF